jgi:uncharacterized protein
MQTCIARHGDAQTFLRRARPWLMQTESENAVILGLTTRAGPSEEMYVATVEQNGAVVGCAVRTPPRKLLLTRMPPGAVDALVIDVAACYDHLPGVLGPETAAREFARQWCERHGTYAHEKMSSRLYRLDRVRTPSRVAPGSMRFATQEDIGLIASWIACFATEAGADLKGARELAAGRIAARELVLWCDDGPRTLAGVSGRSPTGVRIGYVYTPPEWRGRGYATACVAALSQHSLDSGATFCCLYADLSNPRSNGIYQQLGYEPVIDAVEFVFEARHPHHPT